MSTSVPSYYTPPLYSTRTGWGYCPPCPPWHGYSVMHVFSLRSADPTDDVNKPHLASIAYQSQDESLGKRHYATPQ